MLTLIFTLLGAAAGFVLSAMIYSRKHHNVKSRREIYKKLSDEQLTLAINKKIMEDERDFATEKRWGVICFNVTDSKTKVDLLKWVLSIEDKHDKK